MSWFKVDDRLHASRKLVAIPRRHRLAAIGLWTVAGSWSADQETDGEIPDYMIEEWGGTPTLVECLVQAGLWERVDGPTASSFETRTVQVPRVSKLARFVNWAEYQPTKEENEFKREKNREKMRNWRERKRVTNQSVTESLTGSSPVSNLSPVPTRPDPTLTKEPNGSLGGAKRPARARQLPEDFAVSEEMREWAKTAHQVLDVGPETEKFKDYCRANGKTYKDWPAAWRNWIARSRQYAPAARPGMARLPLAPDVEDWELR